MQFVIVGASLAGAKAAEALRELGADGPIVLIGDEPYLPYERPPLSKDRLTGRADPDSIYVHKPGWYHGHGIETRLGRPVTAIDRAAREVVLNDDSRIGYDKLLLATGAGPRALAVPGAPAGGVISLRRIEESERIGNFLATGSRLTVIGAGWIGLEVAAAARQSGLDVTVLESADLPLLRVLGPEVAKVFADLHADHGVDLRFGVTVSEILTRAGRATGVRLADGTTVDTEAVLVSIGVVPNAMLAARAGLGVDNGILVDASLRTSDPDIFAAGDVANAEHPTLGRRIRVEHWANALHQPATAAAGMLGQAASYDELPYFYTDQYDLGMEYTGHVEPGDYDRVVFRGDVGKREFLAFWLKDDRVLAGMNVNVWDVTDPITALIRSGKPVDPTRLADETVPLDHLLPT